MKALSTDIAEGYTTVNPIFLKPFDDESLKELYQELFKYQAQVRAEKFPHHDPLAIRSRNLRLQRLHLSAMIIKTYARARKIQIY
jgi:hypothetical protein